MGPWNVRDWLRKRSAARRQRETPQPPPPVTPEPRPPLGFRRPSPATAAALPSADPYFVGRTEQIAAIVDALVKEGRSMLIHGEPGIGKTALAVQALRSTAIQNAFRDRLLWFERTPGALADLCDAVARPLGFQPVWQTVDVDQKCDILRANLGDYPPLLAFNNADGPAAGAVAAFCQRVVPYPVLATSRDAVPGLQRLDLGPLDMEQALALFASYSRPPTPAEEGDVREVLAFLERNPLAVILAAGRFDGLGAADLLRQLRARPFHVLRDPNRSVRAAFDLSYDLLEPQEQRLFAALGIFEGPDFQAQAVQSLFDADVGLALGRLVDVSLVRRHLESGRHSLHPLLREYARARLEEADPFQLRLAAYYAGFIQQHLEATAEHLDAIEKEFASIHGSVGWCTVHRSQEPPALLLTEIVQGLQWFLMIRGYWRERVEWGREAVEAARLLGNDHRLAIIAGNLATAFQDRGEMEEAERGHREAMEAFQRLGDERNVATALHQMGTLAQGQGRLGEARDYYTRSLEIAERLGDQQGIAMALHQMGILAQIQGRLGEARDYYTRSMEIKERLGYQRGIAQTLHQLGMLAQGQGRLEEARDHYTRSLEIEERLGDQQGIANSLGQLGILAQGQGRLEEARDYYTRCLEIEERLGDQRGIANTLHNLGALAQGQGRLEEAQDYYNRSLEIAERLGDQQGIASSLGQLGVLEEETGNLSEAAAKYQQALAILERLGSPDAEKARRSLQRVQRRPGRRRSKV